MAFFALAQHESKGFISTTSSRPAPTHIHGNPAGILVNSDAALVSDEETKNNGNFPFCKNTDYETFQMSLQYVLSFWPPAHVVPSDALLGDQLEQLLPPETVDPNPDLVPEPFFSFSNALA